MLGHSLVHVHCWLEEEGEPGVDNVVVMVVQVEGLEEQDHHHGCRRVAVSVDWVSSCVGCVAVWAGRAVDVEVGRHGSVGFVAGAAAQQGVWGWGLADQ